MRGVKAEVSVDEEDGSSAGAFRLLAVGVELEEDISKTRADSNMVSDSNNRIVDDDRCYLLVSLSSRIASTD